MALLPIVEVDCDTQKTIFSVFVKNVEEKL